MKTIYVVSQELNDKGWHSGTQLFESAEECAKHMRDYVAQHIMYLRNEGYKIENLRCSHENISGVDLDCGMITFQTMKDNRREWWDFRVFAAYLWETNDQYRNGKWPWNM